MWKIESLRKNMHRVSALKTLVIACFAAAGFILWAWQSSGASRDFAQADDFPRGALCYAQFRDLPTLLKTWDESDLKKRYLDSENFRQLQARHLALKLAARWQEFNDALGFEISANALGGAAENRAAIAIYDIGKMEIVFIAPVGDEKFAATMFFHNRENVEPTELADGTVYYSREVEADRGRQRQKILFANSKNRFVLATSESLLQRALANINGKTRKDRLSDEPAFANLAKRATPHLATIWVDQAKLNEDWYFKRYWAMRNVAQLKTIRAGMFDFEMRDDKLIERREFLLTENKESAAGKISAEETALLQSFVPADTPFFRLQRIVENTRQTAVLLRDIVGASSRVVEMKENRRRWNAYDSFDNSGNYSSGDGYYYLDSKFDEFIDEDDEAEAVNHDNQSGEKLEEFENYLRQILSPAQITAVITAENPRAQEAPLFIQFEKAAVFYLNSPQKLDQQALENAISSIAVSDLTVAGEKVNVSWINQSDAKTAWRELKFPILNREICYAVRENVLVITNSSELLKSFLIHNETHAPSAKPTELFDELSVIRLETRDSAFDAPMNRLFNEENKHKLGAKTADASQDFFTGNIGSLLSAANQAKQIEIKRSSAARFLSEEVVVILRAN